MKTNQLLTCVIVLQSLILIGQWTGTGYLSSARADLPDPANRQLQIVDELKNLNEKMDHLVTTLDSGQLQVKLATSDDNKGSSHSK